MNEAPRPLPVPRAPTRTRTEPSLTALAPGRAPPRVPTPRHAHAPLIERRERVQVEPAPADDDVASRALGLVLKPAARVLARLIGPMS